VSETRCDALIIGGGPAGSTCARRLAAAGKDVIILDKKDFPRDKTCAGWITPAVIEELGLDTDDYARGRTFQPITGFRTGLIGGPTVETRYPKPVSFGIRRCEFDEYLLRRSGARLRLGEKLGTIERRAHEWLVNGSITTPLLIGAGGHFCPVARHLGAVPGKEVAVAAQEIEFELTEAQEQECAVRPGVAELYFCPDLAGYAWCFRKGQVLNVGLGREDPRRLAEHVSSFCQLMKQEGRIPKDTPTQLHGHAYILYAHTVRNVIEDGVLLVGDAAGLAYPQSGEGIRPAIESALMASDVILDASGPFTRRAFLPYSDRLTRRFGKRSTGPPAAPALSSPGTASGLKERIAAHLMTTRWFTRHVLINRWFLHAHQPALATA
jgi:menaquinone-9 beta-reductase